MNLYQFIGLETDEQAKYIPYAIYQATRLEGNYCILLYLFNDFYVEVFFDVDQWTISHIHGFRSRSGLIPYINLGNPIK